MRTHTLLLTLVVTCASVATVLCATAGSAVNALVYSDISVNSYDKCARLLNGTNQIGCQSEFGGNVGVLFHVNQSTVINRMLTGDHNPYIVLIDDSLFKRENVKVFKSSGKVNGIIVYSTNGFTSKENGWSPELQCPRYRYGLYNKNYGSKFAKCDSNPWNSFGDGLTEEDLNFPIFFMTNDTTANLLIECHNKHNIDNEYPLCAAEMKAWMHAAQSTETCLRRNNMQDNLSPATYCDSIGGRTILATLQVTNSSSKDEQKPIILITAAYDSRSFDMTTSSPGANSATGFVSLLAVAHALGSLTMLEKKGMTHTVMFAIFDGEAFDNMGSMRMVYDMSKDKFPFSKKSNKWQPARFNLSHVSHIIEIGQVGLSNGSVYIHHDPLSYTDSKIAKGIDSIINSLVDDSLSWISFNNQSEGIGLVPSSLQSILREKNVSGVVITDFDRYYENRYYFSRYDTPDKLGVIVKSNATEAEALPSLKPLAGKLKNISSVIAKAVYQLATGKTLAKVEINETRMQETLYCYYFNMSCILAKAVTDIKFKNLDGTPIRRYVGVYSKSLKYGPYLARNLLFYSLGEGIDVNKTEQCSASDERNEIYEYYFINRSYPLCIRATVYDMDGRSPSAILKNYDYANGPYGAWSESGWATTAYNLRIFLVQERYHQGMILLVGLLVLICSFAVVFIISRRLDILFSNEIL